MTLTIELSPEEELELAAEAERQGLEVSDLAHKLVTGTAPVRNRLAIPPGVPADHFFFTASPEEFDRALDEIANMNLDVPDLPDEALRRESIYSDY